MISQEYVDQSWELVKRFWTHLNIDRPRIFAKEEEQGLGQEIACFDSATKQIFVDEANLEERLGVDALGTVLNHEAGHHKFCPYGLRMFFRLVANAYKEVRNIKSAKLIENLFADLLVNTHLYSKGNPGIKRVYQKFSQQNDSQLWQFYMSTFEYMINQPGSILPKPAKEQMRKEAAKVGDILSKSLNKAGNWSKAIREFAKAAKKYMDQEQDDGGESECDAGSGGFEDTQQTQDSSTYSQEKQDKEDQEYGMLPIDKHDTEDFLPFDKDKTPDEQQGKLIEKEIKGLAKEVGHETFKEVVSGLGLGTKKQANIWFYRDLTRSFFLEMPKYIGSSSSQPRVPKKWRMSDPISQLNVEYSLALYGILLPGITTYQFVSNLYGPDIKGDEAPDLLIVLDSSGSMPDPDAYDGSGNIDPEAYFSFPVLSAMIAAHAALDHGKKVAVVDFSDGYEYLDFTNQSNDVDDAIVTYFGGGTVIPGDAVREAVSNHRYPTHILIISDTEITNLEEEVDNLECALKRARAGGTVFLDCEPSENTELLAEVGYDVQFTRNFEDLADLTLEKAKGLYEAHAGG